MKRPKREPRTLFDKAVTVVKNADKKQPANSLGLTGLTLEEYWKRADYDENVQHVVAQHRQVLAFFAKELSVRTDAKPGERKPLATFIRDAHGPIPPLLGWLVKRKPFEIPSKVKEKFVSTVGRKRALKLLAQVSDKQDELNRSMTQYFVQRLDGKVKGTPHPQHLVAHAVGTLIFVLEKARDEIKEPRLP